MLIKDLSYSNMHEFSKWSRKIPKQFSIHYNNVMGTGNRKKTAIDIFILFYYLVMYVYICNFACDKQMLISINLLTKFTKV